MLAGNAMLAGSVVLVVVLDVVVVVVGSGHGGLSLRTRRPLQAERGRIDLGLARPAGVARLERARCRLAEDGGVRRSRRHYERHHESR